MLDDRCECVNWIHPREGKNTTNPKAQSPQKCQTPTESLGYKTGKSKTSNPKTQTPSLFIDLSDMNYLVPVFVALKILCD